MTRKKIRVDEEYFKCPGYKSNIAENHLDTDWASSKYKNAHLIFVLFSCVKSNNLEIYTITKNPSIHTTI